MATVKHYSRKSSKIEDKRDISDNKIIDTIEVRMSDPINWTTLRKMSPIPQWSQPHPDEPGFFLDFITPTRVSKFVWHLEAEYTIIKGGQLDPNPLQRKAIVTFGTSLIEEPTFFDEKNNPIVTRAGEFIPGVMRSAPVVEYSVKKNLPRDPDWLLTHLGAINLDAVKLRGMTWPPKTLMLGAVSGGEIIEEERATYSEYQLTIMGDPRKWTHELWNVGTVELKKVSRLVVNPNAPAGSGGLTRKDIWIQVPIKSGDPPVNVEQPVPLDDKGRAIADYLDSTADKPVKPGTLTKLFYDTQKILNFNGILPLV